MANYLRFMSDLIALRKAEPALSAEGVRASRVNDYDRLIVVHRWVADGSPGRDVVAVVSFDEKPKFGYRVGLPRSGRWIEVFNTDVYDDSPNPSPIGNGGAVYANGPPLDAFAQFEAELHRVRGEAERLRARPPRARVATHQFEQGRVQSSIRERADMGEVHYPRLHAVDERNRPIDLPERPRHNRQVEHCADAWVLSEAKGQSSRPGSNKASALSK